MDTKRLVIYHGGSWVGNSYEGGLTKWVHVPRGLTYDALVKLVQNVAKIERQEIAQFVVNPVTTDKIVGMHNHVRFLYHLQHRSDHVDRTGAGNVEKKATIHKNVH